MIFFFEISNDGVPNYEICYFYFGKISKGLLFVKFTWKFVDLPRDDVLIVMKRDTMPVDITGCPPTRRKLQDQEKETLGKVKQENHQSQHNKHVILSTRMLNIDYD